MDARAEDIISVVATCGHRIPIDRMPGPDPFLAQRIARLEGRACRECRVKAAEERNRLAQMQARKDRKIPKGQEVKYLPAGSTYQLARLDDGSWFGRLRADGMAVESVSNGVTGLASKLARKWLAARGATLKGKVEGPEGPPSGPSDDPGIPRSPG